MNALKENTGNSLRSMPWGSNPKATTKYRQHVMQMQTKGKTPLSPQNWWNANRTAIASK